MNPFDDIIKTLNTLFASPEAESSLKVIGQHYDPHMKQSVVVIEYRFDKADTSDRWEHSILKALLDKSVFVHPEER